MSGRPRSKRSKRRASGPASAKKNPSAAGTTSATSAKSPSAKAGSAKSPSAKPRLSKKGSPSSPWSAKPLLLTPRSFSLRWFKPDFSALAPSDQAPAVEPTPWATGLTVSAIMAAVTVALVLALTAALASTFDWLEVPANVLIGLGLAPSVWMSRRVPLWRWVGAGVGAGLVVAWLTLLVNLALSAAR